MVFTIFKVTLFPAIKLWIKKVNGLENISRKGHFIITANHSSYMDHLIIGSIITSYLDKKICWLAKKEHFDTFLQRVWHNYVGAVPLDRESGGKETLRFAVKALKQNKIIAIYPEGTRTLNGKIQKAKTGAARLALLSKAPVLPIGLIGTFKILPKGKYIPKMHKAVMNIGKPMHFPEYYNKKINKKILNGVTTKIMKEIAKLSNQRYDY